MVGERAGGENEGELCNLADLQGGVNKLIEKCSGPFQVRAHCRRETKGET